MDEPIAFLLGGGSASGKSTLGERYQKDLRGMGRNAAYIDCDRIKEQIDEYKAMKLTHPVEAADFVHEESSDIADLALGSAISGRCDIIYDGTMKNIEKYQRLIARLRESGYEVFAIIVDVPLEVAYKRAADRFLIEKRMVSEKDIRRSHQGVAEAFLQLEDLFDGYAIWDNTEYGGEGEIIAEKRDNEVHVENIDRLRAFYEKAGIKK